MAGRRIWSDGSFQRPDDLTDLRKPDVLFGRSYLWTRLVVGGLGILLPAMFIIGEAFFMKFKVSVRGSISAYYHSSMRDFFVGGLCVIGFMLVMYMVGQAKRTDFRLSLVSGLAVLGVVFFPTGRPNLPDGAPLCGETPEPAGCSALQQLLGETLVASVHFVFAAIFILSLAAACFYFAHRERRSENLALAKLQRACGIVIVLSVLLVIVGALTGLQLGALTPLYVGEVAAVWAFGVSWVATTGDLLRALNPVAAKTSSPTTPSLDKAPS